MNEALFLSYKCRWMEPLFQSKVFSEKQSLIK